MAGAAAVEWEAPGGGLEAGKFRPGWRHMWGWEDEYWVEKKLKENFNLPPKRGYRLGSSRVFFGMKLKVFNYNGHLLRVQVREDETLWFVAQDVTTAYGHGNHRMALKRLPEEEKGVTKVDAFGTGQSVSVVSEAGFYLLVLRSNKPEARAFQRWVTHTVLPEIRRNGRYVHGDAPQEQPQQHLQLPESASSISVNMRWWMRVDQTLLLGWANELESGEVPMVRRGEALLDWGAWKAEVMQHQLTAHSKDWAVVAYLPAMKGRWEHGWVRGTAGSNEQLAADVEILVLGINCVIGERAERNLKEWQRWLAGGKGGLGETIMQKFKLDEVILGSGARTLDKGQVLRLVQSLPEAPGAKAGSG